MDEYIIVPKRVMDATQPSKSSHPAESKDVLSLTGLINTICKRPDLDQWHKAGMLRSTLERYLALTETKKEVKASHSIPQEVSTSSELQPVTEPEVVKVPVKEKLGPLVQKKKRSAESEKPFKHVRDGEEVTIPTPPNERPAVTEADLMDVASVFQVEPPASLVTQPRKATFERPALTEADNMELGINPVTEVYAKPASSDKKGSKRYPDDSTDKIRVEKLDRKRKVTRGAKRVTTVPRLMVSKKKKAEENSQLGGLKQRWITLR